MISLQKTRRSHFSNTKTAPHPYDFKHSKNQKSELKQISSGFHSPRFKKEQQVSFLGGFGTIKNYLLTANTWTYAIEMEMGPEPEMGRVGAETMILLNEADIQAESA